MESGELGPTEVGVIAGARDVGTSMEGASAMTSTWVSDGNTFSPWTGGADTVGSFGKILYQSTMTTTQIAIPKATVQRMPFEGLPSEFSLFDLLEGRSVISS